MTPRLRLRGAPAALVAAAAGFLVVAAAINAPRPAGPRLHGKEDLVALIRKEDQRARLLRSRLDAIGEDFARLRTAVEGREGSLRALRAAIDSIAPYAGLTPVEGPGLRVELRDSTLRESPTGNPNDLVVHEEDLQAVVNGLWVAGAEAIGINGERITSASAIRCVGNTLLLHGSVYSPPYRIEALGDPSALAEGLGTDPLVERFRAVAEEFRLGFDVSRAGTLTLPGFAGLRFARFARAG